MPDHTLIEFLRGVVVALGLALIVSSQLQKGQPPMLRFLAFVALGLFAVATARGLDTLAAATAGALLAGWLIWWWLRRRRKLAKPQG